MKQKKFSVEKKALFVLNEALVRKFTDQITHLPKVMPSATFRVKASIGTLRSSTIQIGHFSM